MSTRIQSEVFTLIRSFFNWYKLPSSFQQNHSTDSTLPSTSISYPTLAAPLSRSTLNFTKSLHPVVLKFYKTPSTTSYLRSWSFQVPINTHINSHYLFLSNHHHRPCSNHSSILPSTLIWFTKTPNFPNAPCSHAIFLICTGAWRQDPCRQAVHTFMEKSKNSLHLRRLPDISLTIHWLFPQHKL